MKTNELLMKDNKMLLCKIQDLERTIRFTNESVSVYKSEIEALKKAKLVEEEKKWKYVAEIERIRRFFSKSLELDTQVEVRETTAGKIIIMAINNGVLEF